VAGEVTGCVIGAGLARINIACLDRVDQAAGGSASRIGFLAACAGMIAGCELENAGVPRVIPGPSVPSPVPLHAPYVWDTREELDIWVHNPVTRGPVPISLVGDGRDAVIRIEPKRGLDGWVLRGPDFATPARNVSGLRLWYRWRPDPALGPGAALTFTITASFEAINAPRPPEQPAAYAQLQPAAEWTEESFRAGSFREALDIDYLYLHQFSSNAGVFEIDRIELVQ